MRGRLNEDILRAAETARIGRMIRASEQGSLFYPPGGRPVAIGAADAERIEAVLLRGVEGLIRDQARMQTRIFLVAILAGAWLMLVTALAPKLGGLALTILTPALFAYTLWEGMLDTRFRIARRRWCRAEAARLETGRAIPEPVARRNRRFNLFQMASYAAILAGVARLLWSGILTGDVANAIDGWGVALVLLGWLLYLPAARIDATHRRRRWVD